ncbi:MULTISPECIES: NADH-quinone oxidoreductase subunit J [Amycolatopsis]|uniref:NADH-quinone oxidoreductase subunit J n=1 Tax=Amycolatopsis echigonensis TaxID=2576905 RepID=A0A2N3WLE1_9PSEU|nr:MULTISPECIES: NADH-quinone oxidoreductase subunit J [Amycolatopsis]MBB2500829.1 NADH-quinone oxidoreductase subunit J [Amycolatopsis echigonensis]MCG3751214.1 NADH-quinone oxidoreductase subunit J [Amycolatopsis sp. Poz14]PKV94678.1 NADH:ubiquinone oxidoreductase subunit 6 (subunit J) [Amycolatopsis niigatensis]
MWTQVAFWACAVAAVATGVAVFRVDSMARATFALLASFVFAAGTLLLLNLAYLGILVVLMMIMEMVVMVVFMIMYMMNPAGLMPMTMVHNQKGSLAISGAVFAALAAGIFLVPWPASARPRPADPTRALGEALMGSKMLVMMVLGLCLFATMVATVVLATHRGRYDRYGDRLDAKRPDDPVRGGLNR